MKWYEGNMIVLWPVIMIVLLICSLGCQLGRVEGVSASVGAFERGLWYDHDRREYHENGWGLKFDIVAGHMIRPVPKFWKKDQNPWKGDEPWFVLRLPMIGPYVGVAAGELGFYLGLKTFLVEDRHRSQERYGKWMKEEEYPADPNGTMTYLQISASTRQTRWK